MALAIGVPTGGKFYVDDEAIELERWFDPYPDEDYPEVNHFHRAILKVRGESVELDDERTIQVLPNVFVGVGKASVDRVGKYQHVVREYAERLSEGLNPELPGMLLPRLLIEAPRHIQILREELYLRGKSGDRRY